MGAERYVCIHGHFYQPPRENPWLEAVELEDSARPYHDWNERITAECYAPNAASRILDAEGRLAEIVNNYARISFNFGPTLLAWLEARAPRVLEAIVAADRESRALRSGHGSALAQVYNHMILPLANRRDKEAQVAWGLRDFERRFGRAAEGMWLSETAVDAETLEVLAERGVRFTILSPYQARRVRKKGEAEWTDVSGGRIDPSTAYEAALPSGRTIALFFYDGPVSQAVAFEGLLHSGERLAARLLSALSDARTGPQLAHIATDGESYGHHHRHGDMALAYALRSIEAREGVRLTNYGEFLERHPPEREVEVIERSAWSCPHGVERWRSDCGCCTGAKPGWRQAWRAPLRAALDLVRDELAPRFEAEAAALLRDPWAAREAYVDVVLDRAPGSVARFLEAHSSRPLAPEERVRALELLEMQRHAMLMYTSCAWFFDDVSGIETVQVLRYAARAIQLAGEGSGALEARFLERLESAPSNVPSVRTGRAVYDRSVRPARVDLERVGAHYALSCLFEEYGARDRVFCYRVERDDLRVLSSGKSRLALGQATVASEVTGEARRLTFCVLHLGDHNLAGGVRPFRGDEAYRALASELEEAFARSDIPELVRAVDRNFGGGTYTLRVLFHDEQRRIAGLILRSALERAEAVVRGVYDENAALMRYLTEVGVPLPPVLRAAADFVVHGKLRRAIEVDDFDPDALDPLLEEARREGVTPSAEELSHPLRGAVERLAARLAADPEGDASLARVEALAALARDLPFDVDLSTLANALHGILRERHAALLQRAGRGDEAARAAAERLERLAATLRVRVSGAREGAR
jgi:alpha-amylase/alpha-mannosidase (GH57 family)